VTINKDSRLKRLGAAGIAAILASTAMNEGVRYVAYRDPVGIPTICMGSTLGVRMGMRATPAECDAMTMVDLYRHEDGMIRCGAKVNAWPLGVYEAFLDFTYNVGIGAFCKSTAKRLLDVGNYRAACAQFDRWIYAGKLILKGILWRRDWEEKTCLRDL